MAIEFLTRLGWLSNLQGPGMWAWLPGRFRQERLKPVASGINKTTRMWAWAGASVSYHIALHSSSPPSGGSYKNDVTPLQQTPFSPSPPISCGCNMLMWSPVSVILLLQALAASAAFQQCDLKLYPSKFMKYLVCLNVDLWTFTFYLSAMQLASPFPSLEVEETRSASCHGKVSSRASGQNSSLSTWFPCSVAHPGLALEILQSIPRTPHILHGMSEPGSPGSCQLLWHPCRWWCQAEKETGDFLQELFEVSRVSRVCGSHSSGSACRSNTPGAAPRECARPREMEGIDLFFFFFLSGFPSVG